MVVLEFICYFMLIQADYRLNFTYKKQVHTHEQTLTATLLSHPLSNVPIVKQALAILLSLMLGQIKQNQVNERGCYVEGAMMEGERQ